MKCISKIEILPAGDGIGAIKAHELSIIIGMCCKYVSKLYLAIVMFILLKNAIGHVDCH